MTAGLIQGLQSPLISQHVHALRQRHQRGQFGACAAPRPRPCCVHRRAAPPPAARRPQTLVLSPPPSTRATHLALPDQLCQAATSATRSPGAMRRQAAAHARAGGPGEPAPPTWFSRPSTLSSGTSQPWKSSSQVSLPRMPSLSSFWAVEKPCGGEEHGGGMSPAAEPVRVRAAWASFWGRCRSPASQPAGAERGAWRAPCHLGAPPGPAAWELFGPLARGLVGWAPLTTAAPSCPPQ